MLRFLIQNRRLRPNLARIFDSLVERANRERQKPYRFGHLTSYTSAPFERAERWCCSDLRPEHISNQH